MCKKVCRLCCDNNATLNIFQNDTDIFQKLQYCCVYIKIVEQDGLPTNICGSCKHDLDYCYKFLLKCEASEKKLRSEIISLTNISCNPKDEVKDEPAQNEEQTYDILLENDIDSDDKLVELYNFKTKYKNRKECVVSICSVCGKKCSSPSVLVIHMRSHTNEKPYKCSSCAKEYKDGGTLKRHVERNHTTTKREKKFICELCGKKFFSKYTTMIHLRTHTGETPYACPYCPKQFTQISSLLRHKTRHNGERSHKCVTCSKLFFTKDELKSHAAVHTTEKNYSCPICKVNFKHLSNVKKHVNVKHNDPNSFVCSHCGNTFNTKGALKSHIERHHSEKSGYCKVCCKDVSNLEVHTWKHTGERPLKCEHCPSSFFELRALNHHINFKHKHRDKFKCPVEACLMSFPSKPMMDFHTAKVHGTEIPYPCDKCVRGFYRKSDLARHKLGTHKEKLV